MNLIFRLVPSLVVLSLVPVPLLAASPVPYAITIEHDSPPPPRVGSSDERRDLDGVLERQRSRTPEDCRRAAIEANLDFEPFFGPPYGPLSSAQVRRLKPFFDRVQATSQAYVFEGKNQWRRPRPFRVDPSIKPCVNREASYSYFSGHTTIAHVFALLLGELDSSRAAEWETRAQEIAEDRIVGGVHYPTDVAEGARTAPRLVEALHHNAEFERDLRAVLREFAGR